MIGAPPLLFGRANRTLMLCGRAPTPTTAGTLGTVKYGIGPTTTARDRLESGPKPTRFRARTVHVYRRAAVRWSTTIGECKAPCRRAMPPLTDVPCAR